MTKVEDLCEKLREMMRRALGVKFNWSSVMVKKVSDYPNLCDVIENGMLDLLGPPSQSVSSLVILEGRGGNPL